TMTCAFGATSSVMLASRWAEWPCGLGVALEPVPIGTGNSEMAWVAGLIIPILTAENSLNQRLPSGPTVIAAGPELAVGVENSVMAWVAGLISPILPTPVSVNQRLPSGHTVIQSG